MLPKGSGVGISSQVANDQHLQIRRIARCYADSLSQSTVQHRASCLEIFVTVSSSVALRHAMSVGHLWVFMSQLVGILMGLTLMALSCALHDLPTDLGQLSTISRYSLQVLTIYIKYVTILRLKI